MPFNSKRYTVTNPHGNVCAGLEDVAEYNGLLLRMVPDMPLSGLEVGQTTLARAPHDKPEERPYTITRTA